MNSWSCYVRVALLLNLDPEIVIAKVGVEMVAVARHVTGVESTVRGSWIHIQAPSGQRRSAAVASRVDCTIHEIIGKKQERHGMSRAGVRYWREGRPTERCTVGQSIERQITATSDFPVIRSGHASHVYFSDAPKTQQAREPTQTCQTAPIS